MNATARRKVGRPIKVAKPGAKASLGLKIRPEVKSHLEWVASENGRTQSQEAEYRLERSFSDDAMFPSEELRLQAYLMTRAFSIAGRREAVRSGQPAGDDQRWMDDPDCLLPASFAVVRQLSGDLIAKGADPALVAVWLQREILRITISHEPVGVDPAKQKDNRTK